VKLTPLEAVGEDRSKSTVASNASPMAIPREPSAATVVPVKVIGIALAATGIQHASNATTLVDIEAPSFFGTDRWS